MRVGVLGSGQLGKMLALAGIPLGMEFVFYGPDPEPCVKGLGKVIIAEFTDQVRLTEFISSVDVVTPESEHIPYDVLAFVESKIPLHANAQAVAIAQNRLKEKNFLRDLGIPVPDFTPVSDADSMQQLLNEKPGPFIVKTCFEGYDGKGQAALNSADDIPAIVSSIGNTQLVAEQRIAFNREVSQVCVRNRLGDIRYYPLTENLHHHGILRKSIVSKDDPLDAQARDYARRVLNALNYVGVMCFEFFDHNNSLLANEIAPRVHNSGHWTIEGAVSSQFENHLRAILDLPLGSTDCYGYSVMCNLLETTPDIPALLDINGAHVHIYGKAARSGRKLGHVTFCYDNRQKLDENTEVHNKIINIR